MSGLNMALVTNASKCRGGLRSLDMVRSYEHICNRYCTVCSAEGGARRGGALYFIMLMLIYILYAISYSSTFCVLLVQLY